MADQTIIPVVLAGGCGARLWPLSRASYPKQFLPLTSEHSMLQETIARVRNFPNMSNPTVICNDKHRFLVAKQLLEANVSQAEIILEPVSRNTAPASALAALHALAHHQDPYLLLLAADHVIHDVEAFHTALKTALQTAAQEAIILFGGTR